MSMTLSYDPRASTPVGFTRRVAPSWGAQATGGTQGLWGRETMAGMANGGFAPGNRLNGEVGYGLPVGSRFVGTPPSQLRDRATRRRLPTGVRGEHPARRRDAVRGGRRGAAAQEPYTGRHGPRGPRPDHTRVVGAREDRGPKPAADARCSTRARGPESDGSGLGAGTYHFHPGRKGACRSAHRTDGAALASRSA